MTDQEFIEAAYGLAFGKGAFGDDEYDHERVLARLKVWVSEMPNFVSEKLDQSIAEGATQDTINYCERVIADAEEFMERVI